MEELIIPNNVKTVGFAAFSGVTAKLYLPYKENALPNSWNSWNYGFQGTIDYAD